MAAADFVTYEAVWRDILSGVYSWSTAAAEVGCWCLVSTAYTPDRNHEIFSDISANEVSTGGDYERVQMNTLTVSTAITGGRVTVDCADVSFGASVTISAKYMVGVASLTNGLNPASSDLLIGYVDLNSVGDAIASAAGPFDVTINASGLFDVNQST